MFVMMADIHLKEGADDDFKEWFAESTKALSGFSGFISRRLLSPADTSGASGSYRIVVEHESKETFIKMHQSPEHQKIHPKGHSFMSTDPVRNAFTVAVK